jgi:hypothetical protein
VVRRMRTRREEEEEEETSISMDHTGFLKNRMQKII